MADTARKTGLKRSDKKKKETNMKKAALEGDRQQCPIPGYIGGVIVRIGADNFKQD